MPAASSSNLVAFSLNGVTPYSNMVSSNVVQGVASSNAATIDKPNLELEGSHSSQWLFLPDWMTPLAPLPYALSKDLEP